MSIEQPERHISSRETLFNQQYHVSAHRGSEKLWNTFGEPSVRMYRDVFAPLLPDEYNGWPKTSILVFGILDIKKRMFRKETTFVALEDKIANELVGFTYAYSSPPDIKTLERKREYGTMGVSYRNYKARQRRTAEVGWTCIKPDHRSRGGWSHMMDLLETELKQTGSYDEMVRIVRNDDNYANGKVRSRYQKNIVNEFQVSGSLGKQTFFRIRL